MRFARILPIVYAHFFIVSTYACFTKSFSGIDLKTGKEVIVNPAERPSATIVVFLSASCPCSKSHEPVLKALAEEFSEFSFFGVQSNASDNLELVKFHFQNGPIPFPVIQDNKLELANQFKALKTPHAFVISPKGKCLFQGGIDDSRIAPLAKNHFLRDALIEIRQGREPKESKVRTLGCIIKR